MSSIGCSVVNSDTTASTNISKPRKEGPETKGDSEIHLSTTSGCTAWESPQLPGDKSMLEPQHDGWTQP
eukprot:jgi/Botrbrau1/16673/Bobra.0068s0089.1